MLGDTILQRDFMQPGRSVAVATKAMVATSHPQASLAALDVLRSGGNAVDAAIAAVALQGVIDPHMTGIGGDCFALYAPAGSAPIAFNGSGFAPAAASPEALADRGITQIGNTSAHAVTVPGAVDAWCKLSAEHGRLGLAAALDPAIKAAEHGYIITPRVALDWARYADTLRSHGPAARQFLPNSQPPVVGQRLDHPVLARTLRRIAAEGREAFYQGTVAQDMVATLQAAGGLHTLEDFAAYRAIETKPISAAYRGYELVECPPNGQGLAALIIARILEGFDLGASHLTEVDRIHLLAEATKAAYRHRDLHVADPSTMTVAVDDLLAEPWIAALRAQIRLDRASPAGTFDLPLHRDTVFVAVVDEDGNTVSMINSIFTAFGSGIYAPRAGVLFQNRGAGFTLDPRHPNVIGPRKRPFHTIIPAMVMRDGALVMTFGVMGGQYQAVGHAHLLSQIVDRHMDLQMASDQPRSFFVDGAISLETTLSPLIKADLESRGHATRWADEPIGGCQAIWIDRERGVLWGASDHRKDGIALGY